MMEFFRGELLPASLEALGQARRLGTAFGLSVYALVPLPSEPDSGDEDLTARCGRYGADKVVMLTGEGLQSEGEMRFACYSGALLAACAQLPPRLFLLGDTPAARDIAPRLASRLGAAYLPRGAALEIDGQLVLCDETGEHVAVEGEALDDESIPPPPPPVLMTVPPGRFQLASGAQDAEMLIIAAADSVQTSDATPVAAAGFTEDGVDVLPLSYRLAGPGFGDEEGDAVAPALWRLHENADGQLESPDAAQYRIALEIEAKQAAFADYTLAVAEKDLEKTRAALLTQLAQPAPPKPAIKWSSRSGFEELSHLTPTGELDGWGTGDLAPTGDTDTTREVAAVAPASHPPEEPLAPPTAAPAPAAVRSAAAVPIDAAMWEGFATPPSPRGPGENLRPDGAPSFELETADTAPVMVVAPSSQASARRSSESPRPAPSARRPAPSSQSPGRSRPTPHPDRDAQAAKDPKDAASNGDDPPSDPGALVSAAKPHDRTEDP